MDTTKYNYDALTPGKRGFRLLRPKKGTGHDIQGELIHSIIGRNDIPYEAVSYTWGLDFKIDNIRIHGRNLPITVNLSLILRDLRSPETDRILWIDAVCINQDNDSEKGHQVQHMRDVYSSAERVLFCISRATEDTEILMFSLERLQDKLQACVFNHYPAVQDSWRKVQIELANNHLGTRGKEIDTLISKQIQGLKHILSQSWFRRVWILQEVACARDALVYCGTRSVSATVFVLSIQLLGLHINQDELIREVINLMPGPSREPPYQDLYSLLRKFRHAEATNTYDKIYALFGLCEDARIGTTLETSYEHSTINVIRNTIAHICNYDMTTTTRIPYRSIDHFLDQLDTLDSGMLLHFLRFEDAQNALRFYIQRKKYLYLTMEMLHRAATDTMQKEEMMERLLELPKAEEVPFHCYQGIWEPLLWAVTNGHEAVVRLLLEKGAKHDNKDDNVHRALSVAARNGQGAIVKLLLEKGAELDDYKRFYWTPLSWAAVNGDEATTRMLLEKGAKVERQDGNGRTALSWAAVNGDEATTRMLLEKGAKVESQDSSGRTALSWAAGIGHGAIVKLLLEKGAELDAYDRDYRTPLSWAAGNGQEATTRMLLEKGADTALQNEYGFTPLWWAAKNEHKAIVKLLFETGAYRKLSYCDYSKISAWARSKGYEDVVNMLLRQGR